MPSPVQRWWLGPIGLRQIPLRTYPFFEDDAYEQAHLCCAGGAVARGNSVMLVNLTTVAATAAQRFSSNKVKAALGSPVAAGSWPRTEPRACAVLVMQPFLTQPAATFTEVSGGQNANQLFAGTAAHPE